VLPAKRFMTPEPRSHGSITGWRITTLNTRIPGWAIAHRESTLHHFNKPRVRSNGGNSNVYKGHDTFMISKALTRIYYVIEGTGVFTIDNQRYDVASGLLVEVPRTRAGSKQMSTPLG